MHVGIDREDEMEPTGGDIFPEKNFPRHFYIELSPEEQCLLNATKANSEDACIHFDMTTFMMVINTIRELKQSNKLRSDSGTII